MAKRKTEISVAYLRNFAAVVKFGSISAAADKMGLATSTVWQQIRLLEKYFECTLVSKQDGLTKATPNGLTLARYADNMLDVLEHAHLDLQKETQRESLHIRFDHNLPASLRAGFVEKLLAEFDGSVLNIKHVTALHSIDDTPVYNDLDVGLTGYSTGDGPDNQPAGNQPTGNQVRLGALELVWACRPENNTLNVAEFNVISWSPDTPFHGLMQTSLAATDIAHKECAVVDDIDTMTGMIEGGLGIGLVPKLTAREKGLVAAGFLPDSALTVDVFLKFTSLKINAQFQSSLQRLLTLSNG